MDLFSEAEWEALDGYEMMTPDQARRFRESITARGLGPWTYRVFTAFLYSYGQVRDDGIFERNVFGRYLDLFPEATTAAINQCWQQGWIQRLSLEFLASQQSEIEERGYEIVNNLIGADLFGDERVGIDRMIGRIDLTAKGVAIFYDDREEHSDHWVIRRTNAESGEVFGTSEEACRFPLDMAWNFTTGSPIEIEASERIGRWCDRWWHRFERGHRLVFRVHDPIVAESLLGTPI